MGYTPEQAYGMTWWEMLAVGDGFNTFHGAPASMTVDDYEEMKTRHADFVGEE